VTWFGTVANPGAPETRSMTTGPSNDGRSKEMVPVELSPAVTVSGDNVILSTRGGTTSTVIVSLLPAYVAWTATTFGGKGIGMGLVWTSIEADILPTGIVTVAGTITRAGLSLVS